MDDGPDRLDSWKEIAAHFRRTVRTVQRWEAVCGLPVHRHGHRESSSVYAFRSEVDAWWLNRTAGTEAPDAIEVDRSPRRTPLDVSAGDLHQMARTEWNRRTVDGIRRSIALARRAIERDPTHAPSHGMLALAEVVLASYTPEPAHEPMTRARQAATRALELDGRIADAHTALGLVYLSYDWRWTDAEHAFRRATELQPNDATAWCWRSFWQLSRGHLDRALIDVRRAEQLDPAALIIRTHVAWVLFFMRRYAEALDQLERTLTQDPQFWRAYLNAAWTYMALGRHADAVGAMETTLALHDYPLLRAIMARAYARAGRHTDARMTLEKAGAAGQYQSAYYAAQAWLALCDREEAGRLLEQAYADREWHLIFVRLDPGLDDIRDHPAYRRVIAGMAF